MVAGRDTRRWRKLKVQFRARSAEANHPCWLCGQPIDYDLPRDHPEAFQPDHLHPVSTHPEHAEDPANLRPSHATCNKARGNRAPLFGLGRQTRQW
ncbi:HNH endonuclease [Rhodococcus sp. PAM 2766]|uniref:HNH endonuclease n=1 Tax=Rhodococcus parequi TaxID=3137122 RepID=A0ABW9FER4_9NOCA